MVRNNETSPIGVNTFELKIIIALFRAAPS